MTPVHFVYPFIGQTGAQLKWLTYGFYKVYRKREREREKERERKRERESLVTWLFSA